MTVNPEVAPGGIGPFRPDEVLHVFRFDTDADRHADVVFGATGFVSEVELKVRFGDVFHRDGSGERVQRFTVRRAIGPQARSGADGTCSRKG